MKETTRCEQQCVTSKGTRKCDDSAAEQIVAYVTTKYIIIKHAKTRQPTSDNDFCVVEINIHGLSFDFVERSCGYNVLKKDDGCYDETADVLPVHKWHPYVS